MYVMIIMFKETHVCYKIMFIETHVRYNTMFIENMCVIIIVFKETHVCYNNMCIYLKDRIVSILLSITLTNAYLRS